MSGYLNNFMGYFLNFFKKETRTSAGDATACSTPPRRCNSVIENRKLKENFVKHNAKQKSIWSSIAGKINQQKPCFAQDSRGPNKGLLNPASFGKLLNRNEADTKQANERGDGTNSSRECCIYHDAAVGFSKEFPRFLPRSARKLQLQEQPSYSLRRSLSLESCYPAEDKKQLASRQLLQMRHILSPIDSSAGICLSLDSDKNYAPFGEFIDLSPGKHSERSLSSLNMFVEDHRPKASKIPVYRKKHRPAKVSKRLPKQFESAIRKEPECTCYRELLASPLQRSWRVEGHAIYCPKSVVAYRSYLNTKLENLFRVISKKKYCGNIIDAASHSRWMKLAGVGVDEDAAYFKKFAKGRVVLPISEYKGALQKLCSEKNLDYWDLVRKMTDIEISSADSNSTISGWKGSR
ncbi:hypothetical protein HNY73_009860 [Argiope bruennichi]|uniref:Uncharacterized protein n=1 Tax=Argiope bruennichi TaxID=94029 RepID=A0A8T0FBR4_ARGBR|nr:hypothetical protein HNY73_009860 [Argiope bruennichi]